MKFTSSLPLMCTMLACTNGANLRNSRVRGLRTRSEGRSKGGSKGGSKDRGERDILGDVVGAIFSATNAAPADESEPLGNELVMYHQLSDGSLKGPVGRYQTGGTGINAGSSQNSILVRGNQVFVANGSNNPVDDSPEARTSGSVSRFAFNEFGALLTSEIPSGGENPVALALCDNILYVANAAFLNGLNLVVGFEPPHPVFNSSITALYVEDDGSLTPLPGLTQDLGPARSVDLLLSPDKSRLVVAASALDESVLSFELEKDTCLLTGAYTNSAPGEAVNPVALSTLELGGEHYLYSGNIGDGSVSAFRMDQEENRLELVNNAAGPGSSAALCWTVIVDGKYLYTANAVSSTISSFEIDQDNGSVTLLELIAAESLSATGSSGAPFDMYVDGNILYVLFGAFGEIYAYRVGRDGKLTQEPTIGGLPGSDVPFRRPLGLAGGKFNN